MKCKVCCNPDGPCRVKRRECPFFMGSLTEDFNEAFVVPCYIKKKIDLMYTGRDVMHAEESSPNGAVYYFDLVKSEAKTCISGAEWIKFLADFNMEVGDKVLFVWDKNIELPMKITPLDAKLNDKFRHDYEYPVDMSEVYENHNVVVITKPLKFLFQHKVKWERVVLQRGFSLGPLFVHKLTTSNVDQRNMKIPKKVADVLNMGLGGVVFLVGKSKVQLKGTGAHAVMEGKK